jgi:NADPH:quinone reductase-like Zn-dependent oxidoreductase
MSVSATQPITAWLAKIGLERYAAAFADNDIDVSVLRHLTDADLEKIGVSLGNRRKILAAIGELSNTPAAPAPPATPRIESRIATPAVEAVAERRQVTVMFSDLVGSTALSARMNPETCARSSPPIRSASPRLCAGDTVLIQGTGGVSLFGLQFSAMFGARAIVTSSSDAKLERAKSLGATHTINYVKTPVWHPEVRALNGGRGIDHVIEVGGPDSFLQSLQAIRIGGQINMVGYIAGKHGAINPLEILYHRATVRGIPVGSRESFEAMNRAIEANNMRPVIDKVFPWTDAVAAIRYMQEGKHFGKIILKFPAGVG